MKKNTERVVEDLIASVQAANALVAELGARDGVDTAAYGFMIRRAGAMSLSLHNGIHPSEEVPDQRRDARDPRLPRARPGMSVSGALKTDLRRDIEERHDELVRLHRWHDALGGRTPTASDFRWDPVMLELLRMEGVDLDSMVARGPGMFVSRTESRNRSDIAIVTDGPAAGGQNYVGIIDGDTVRAQRIRYSREVSYSWSRRHPAHVDLEVRGMNLPDAVMRDIIGSPLSTAYAHASLAKMLVQGYSQQGSTTCFKSATRLVRP